MTTSNELLVQMNAVVLDIMKSHGVTVVELTKITDCTVEGTADDSHIVIGRVWDGNDHHMSIWHKSTQGKVTFIHSGLSKMKGDVHDMYETEQRPIREAQLQASYKQLEEEEVANRPDVDDSDDWF